MGLKEIRLRRANDLISLVPENEIDNISPTFLIDKDNEKAYDYYLKNGYAIIRGCINPNQCDEIRSAWDSELKNYKGYLIRQSSDIPEKNIFNDKNWVMNSLQHIQTLSKKDFPRLRGLFEEYICDNLNLKNLLSLFLSCSRPRLVQSMYFEGNTATAAHQDSYYLDDEEIGRMAAAWIALEDIQWNSGRFFICPQSHKVDNSDQNRSNSFTNMQKFLEDIISMIRENKYEIRAPYLKKGDILIWNSLTIHGALSDIDPVNSRSSITAHFTRSNKKFRTYRHKLEDLVVEKRKHMDVHRLYSYDNLFTKLKIFTSVRFPKLKGYAKKIIYKHTIFSK